MLRASELFGQKQCEINLCLSLIFIMKLHQINVIYRWLSSKISHFLSGLQASWQYGHCCQVNPPCWSLTSFTFRSSELYSRKWNYSIFEMPKIRFRVGHLVDGIPWTCVNINVSKVNQMCFGRYFLSLNKTVSKFLWHRTTSDVQV